MSFISQVGAGSNWHVLFSAEPIICSTSSCVMAVHCASVGDALVGTSNNGVDAVETRTESILSVKYVAKSSAVLVPVSSAVASSSTPCSARHSFFESSLLTAIAVRQKLLHFASYNLRISFNLSAQTRLSASVRRRLKRISAALTLRRMSRHSASNHGVAGLTLRRTSTNAACQAAASIQGKINVQRKTKSQTVISRDNDKLRTRSQTVKHQQIPTDERSIEIAASQHSVGSQGPIKINK